MPSQCNTSVIVFQPFVIRVPTAQTLFAEMPTSPESLAFPTSGPDAILHCVPSQCMIIISSFSPLLEEKPTAHASSADKAATPDNELWGAGGLGLGTVRHCVPSHRW